MEAFCLRAKGRGWFYNCAMRLALILPLLLSSVTLSWAQSAAPQAATSTAIEKRTERIRIEDAGSRIDELRVGGETKTITVQPKGGMPAYEVQPKSGERSWKILGF
jgi:hypothetical protein